MASLGLVKVIKPYVLHPPISSNYSGRKHTVFALDDEPISNIVLLGDYTGLGFTGSGTWFILNCQEIGNKELVLICHELQ